MTCDVVWWAVGAVQFRVLPSESQGDDIFESRLRTWATVPPVLTKHTPPFSLPRPQNLKWLRPYLVQATAQAS